MTYPPYEKVSVKKSNGSYGRWVVKTSEVSFRFFWKKRQAAEYAERHNSSALLSRG